MIGERPDASINLANNHLDVLHSTGNPTEVPEFKYADLDDVPNTSHQTLSRLMVAGRRTAVRKYNSPSPYLIEKR
ncbi:hypothetical protein EVAR_28978_1 [Eumeta japonica]|uniref:Uncharacterized protein n=1 Tax=Eumeta variegata TaxID=151549 RepID=A0A4C1W2Y7_EUMVA|nr:hypothetical protein EVAR_28978_1 [Eumeta japonica]